MSTTTSIRADYILWDVSNRKDWQMCAKGSYEDCQKAATEIWENPTLEGMEIHPNKIRYRWNNPITGDHYDLYMDGTCEDRPMTEEEIEAEK